MRINDSFLKYSDTIEKVKLNNGIKTRTEKTTPEKSFETLLNEAKNADSITFSKHALLRMNERDIEMSGSEMEKLNSAVESADAKGIRESLILMGGKAFIVNVPSNVVVTVLDSGDISKQKVFTNLDGAVII